MKEAGEPGLDVTPIKGAQSLRLLHGKTVELAKCPVRNELQAARVD